MWDNLFLKNLSVEGDGTQCYISIPLLKKEYFRFEIFFCDKDGKYLKENFEPRIVEKVRIQQNQNRIYFERSRDKDLYYKIVPVLNNGSKIQTDENNLDNVITVKMIPSIIKYSYIPPTTKGCFLSKLRGIQNAKLDITCVDNIACGEIGYVKNSTFLPLPQINKNGSFLLPIDDISINLVKANNKSKHTIEKA